MGAYLAGVRWGRKSASAYQERDARPISRPRRGSKLKIEARTSERRRTEPFSAGYGGANGVEISKYHSALVERRGRTFLVLGVPDDPVEIQPLNTSAARNSLARQIFFPIDADRGTTV